MTHLVQRIIVNAYGWTKPSRGRLGSFGEGEYVRANGFGHEDWNFNRDLAVHDCIYGYFNYAPSAEKATDRFNVAFVIYTDRRWRLIGFYLDAEFVPGGAPTDAGVLRAKLEDLLELRASNSLGKPWADRDNKGIIRKLKDEEQWLRWRVHIKNAIVLPQPVAIAESLFKSSNYHLTRPTAVDAETFQGLRALANEVASLEDDDQAAFPEGREMWLTHKARERSPAVVHAAKARFFREHGKFLCQACGFDFQDFYGEIGKGFIEAHHTIPVSELRPASKTRSADIALVCSNCHRMLHRQRPWVTMSLLKTLLKEQMAPA